MVDPTGMILCCSLPMDPREIFAGAGKRDTPEVERLADQFLDEARERST